MEKAQHCGFLRGVLAQSGSRESFSGGNQKNQNIAWEVRNISDPWAKEHLCTIHFVPSPSFPTHVNVPGARPKRDQR